jgi:hypothetical protein
VTMEFLLSGWPPERIEAATSFVHDRVCLDIATSGLQQVWIGDLLVFGMEDGEVIGTAFGGEHWFPVHLDEGAETACALTADQMQDGVIDRLGRPWPELLDPHGAFVGVLDVAKHDGIACWVLRGVPFCAVGQLAGAVPAAGYTLREPDH